MIHDGTTVRESKGLLGRAFPELQIPGISAKPLWSPTTMSIWGARLFAHLTSLSQPGGVLPPLFMCLSLDFLRTAGHFSFLR